MKKVALPILVLLSAAAAGSARDRGPKAGEIKKAIAEYFGADEDRRTEILELLDRVPPLEKRDVAKWRKVIEKEMTAWLRDGAREENGAAFRAYGKRGVFHVKSGDARMKYFFNAGGRRGRGGVALYFNFHGGGNSAATNDSAWEGAKSRYGFAGCTIAPRSTQDVALSWAVPEIWPLMDRLLAECFLLRGVDPDKVYIHGYSMGGWGTLLMGPAMADRWAAVGSSAGGEHVARAHPQNLRNTPIIIQIGTEDHAFRRYALSKAFADRLNTLHAADPDGYEFEYREHEGAGHQISDADSPGWLAGKTRDPYPEKVVWKPVDATRGHVRSFYWVAVDEPTAAMEIVVTRNGNEFAIERAKGVKRLTILLNDAFADLDEPVTVKRGGEELHAAIVERRIRTLLTTFARRADRRLTFSARIDLDLTED